MSAPPDTPPKEDKDGKITINVQFPDDTISFKIKRTAPFSKVYSSIATNRDISEQSFSLAYDGVRISKEQTPKMLEMEDGVQVDVQLAQVGGAL